MAGALRTPGHKTSLSPSQHPVSCMACLHCPFPGTGVLLLTAGVPPTSWKHSEPGRGQGLWKCFENKNNIYMQDMIIFLG